MFAIFKIMSIFRFLLKLRLSLRVYWDGDLTDGFVWLPDTGCYVTPLDQSAASLL